MSDRYRFPPELGGGERPSSPNRDAPPGTVAFAVTDVDNTGAWVVYVPLALLTKVDPPRPEPPMWSVVQIGGSFFERTDRDWVDLTTGARLPWVQVCEVGTPTRLVPDPSGDPVELPWTHVDPYGAKATIRTWPVGIVRVEIPGSCDLLAGEARSMAHALWAAADAAERES
jgi:hypothetical protein